MIYTKKELLTAFFIDIIAAPITTNYNDLSEQAKDVWNNAYGIRFMNFEKNNDNITGSEEDVYNKYVTRVPEFCKITGVSYGIFEDDMSISVDTIAESDEKKTLEVFNQILDKASKYTLSGYNLAVRAIPFITKRMHINGLKLPFLLNLRGKKPWEISMIDVMKDYQGTTFEYLPLDALNFAFGIKLDDNVETDSKLKVEAIMQMALALAA